MTSGINPNVGTPAAYTTDSTQSAVAEGGDGNQSADGSIESIPDSRPSSPVPGYDDSVNPQTLKVGELKIASVEDAEPRMTADADNEEIDKSDSASTASQDGSVGGTNDSDGGELDSASGTDTSVKQGEAAVSNEAAKNGAAKEDCESSDTGEEAKEGVESGSTAAAAPAVSDGVSSDSESEEPLAE
ncbi:hypothetical protein [Endozoicomonas ascidiicola]|uniref:hypothetical protein n=1 Tax=Endozoicomonas ascidiicola TaxID=1698521 RepID=UPI00082F7916|nr:hypothetical protein [Endozoicomonas ascidiicola]